MKSINIRGSGHEVLGYGKASINILRSLVELGVEVAFFPISNVQLTYNDQRVVQAYDKREMLDPAAPCLQIWHEFDLSQWAGYGKRVALSFFEINKLCDKRKHHLRIPELIISPSNWAAEVIRNHVETPVEVVHMGVDTTVFYPIPKQDTSGIYRFLNIGKWEVRKGHDVLIEAFNLAFRDDDAVELVLLTNNGFLKQNETQEWVDLYTKSRLGNKVRFVEPLRTDQLVSQLINKCDCCVFPTRAEGFGLPILESLACGKPLITTDYSAHADFCNPSNSHLVNITEMERAYDGKWFNGFGEWGRIGKKEIQQLADHMRLLYDNRKDQKINEAGVKTAHGMSWRTTSEQILKAL